MPNHPSDSPTWTAGKKGGGLGFDGTNDCLTAKNDASLSFEKTDPFSIEAWVRFQDTGLDKCIASRSSGGVGIQLSKTASNKLNFYMSSDGDMEWAVVQSSGSVSLGAWHHVVATYNGSGSHTGMKLYLDGSPMATTGSTSGLGSILVSEPWRFGQLGTSTGINVQGLMDEIVLYDKVLTPAEVASRFSAP